MAIRITKDGIKHVPGLRSHIGKDADVAVKQIENAKQTIEKKLLMIQFHLMR